ncbi:SRPBCC family protein [Bacillus sp. JJ1562]|uniref:SRPBCC family protein n=1 Tax=Bacillus sp. JJ1562 TaxID=3122960 RepID=UPI003002C641
MRILTKTSITTLTMIRQFDVAPEAVFNAWTQSDMIKKWLFTMEHTNKVAKNEPHVGGTWEIVDHRNGKDYRAIGEYLEIDRPSKLVFTFKMPQFSDTQDVVTVVINPVENGSEMTFTQEIVVPHEEGWTEEDIEKSLKEYNESSEQGWNWMFMGLKQLVETGKINYPS